MGEKKSVPYFFIGDAFSLSENLMKVYPGQYSKDSKEQIFNNRIRRARRVVQNVFGLLSSVFQVLCKPMLLEPEKAQLIMSIACLHNFLRRSPDLAAIYTLPGTFDYEENGQVTEGS